MDDPIGIAREDADRLGRYIRRRVASAEESEDILQDVFLAFYSRWNLGEAIHDVAAWLFRTAGNKIVDFYRRKGRAPASLDGTSGRDLDVSDLWDLVDATVVTPEDSAARQELRETLARAIEALPEDQRRVFLLHEMEGKSFKEMEGSLQVPLNTLLSRKRYAVLKLRETLAARLGPFLEELMEDDR